MLGDVKFGKGGEWAESRVLQVQFQNIKGNDVAQFKDVATQVVVSPPAYVSGKVSLSLRKGEVTSELRNMTRRAALPRGVLVG